MKSKVLNIMKQNSYRTINGKDIRYALEQQGINLSPLALRKLIQSLRNEGHPISANHIGYKYHDLTQPIERKAMSEYIESRRREIRQESITINILSNLLMDATNTHTKKYNDFAEAVFNSDYKETLIDCWNENYSMETPIEYNIDLDTFKAIESFRGVPDNDAWEVIYDEWKTKGEL